MTARFAPDWAVVPGEIMKELLAEQNVSIRVFRRMVGLSQADADAFLLGERPLTEDLAGRLEAGFGVPRSLWRNLEQRWRQHQTDQLLKARQALTVLVGVDAVPHGLLASVLELLPDMADDDKAAALERARIAMLKRRGE